MIRQAISCDICGAEKKQTNHWFVAWENEGELRVSGWSSRNRGRAGSKHLCGQACLHKLADDFMERVISHRVPAVAIAEEDQAAAVAAASSATAQGDCGEIESSARLITPPPTPVVQPTALVPILVRTVSDSTVPPLDPFRHTPRTRYAEAWERERERTIQSRRA